MIDRGEIDYEEDIEIDNQFMVENNINNVYEQNNENALTGIKKIRIYLHNILFKILFLIF